MEVATWYRSCKIVHQSSPKSLTIWCSSIPLTMQNLAALWQIMSEISAVKNFRFQKSRPNFTKFWEHVSIGKTLNHAKFHRCQPNGIREKRYNFFKPFTFWPRGPLGQSLPVYVVTYFMVALCNRADHIYFHPVSVFFFLFFSSPNLSGRRLDVSHTSTHDMVWP